MTIVGDILRSISVRLTMFKLLMHAGGLRAADGSNYYGYTVNLNYRISI